MGRVTRYNVADSTTPPPKPSTSRPRIVIERMPNGVSIKRHPPRVPSVKSLEREPSRGELQTQDHLVPIEQIYMRLNTHPVRGLSYANVEANLSKYGANVLSPLKTTPEWVKYMQHLVGGFAVCLWLAAVLCFCVFFTECTYMDDVPADFLYLGVALLAVIFITGTFTYLQEYNNDQIMESFKNMVPQYTSVIRNNYKIVLNVKELVMGDIVEVKAGDRIPADLRIIDSQGLKVDNSSLTGESEPLLRLPECTSDDPMETYNLAFFSTMAVEGSARGVVIEVGDRTVMGKIARLASALRPVDTPLCKEMHYFVKILCARAVFLGLIFFSVAFSMGSTWAESIFFLIGVIVANVPEGLLSFITVCLAITARRMASKNCLVKHLQAVETLGSTSTICSDKTGTLTQNNMTVSHLWFNNHLMEVDTSELRSTDDRFDERNSDFKALGYVGMLCSRATFLPGQERFSPYDRRVNGDASESAILKFFETQIGNVENFRRHHPKLFEIPFNSTSKYQVSIHQINNPNDPHLLLVMKGAPEKILDLCSTILIDEEELELDDEWRETVENMQYTLGNLGERVFGFCDYRLPISYVQSPDFAIDSDSPEFLQYGFRHVGLMSLMDPPRSKVPDAVLKCRSAGIRVVMVTGDHPITAKAIARSVGILSAGNETADEMASRLNIDVNDVDLDRIKAAVIEGPVLRTMSDAELDATFRKHTEIVFARTSPQQKLAIVEALQRQNHVVAVTGDGVNDSPALKRADIGIAMGISGSDVSKETADIILLDDNFASIVTGVEEGRKIFDNLKKCSFYALTDNIAELMPFFFFVILKVPLPLGTIAMLMIDLGTDVLPAISLAYEKPESDIMKQMPRNCKKDRLITNKLISYSYGQIGMIQACAGFFTYLVILAQNGFWPSRILGIRPQWDSRAVNDLTDSYGQEWTFHARKKLEYTCHTGYFIAVVVAQWANLIICKTRRVSVFDKGMKNWYLNFALLAETALAAFLSYCPGMDSAFKTYPLKLHWWFITVPFALLIFCLDEARRYIIRNYKGSWFEEEFYY